MNEKKEAVAALEARIRGLECGAGAERQDLVAQLQAAQRQLQECEPPRPLATRSHIYRAILGCLHWCRYRGRLHVARQCNTAETKCAIQVSSQSF